MRLLSFSIIAVFLNLTTPVLSQNIFYEGFVVKKSGDTLKGYVKLQGDKIAPTGVLYKKSDKSTFVTFANDDLESVVLNNYRYFRIITINDQRLLAQLLVQGRASLYSWNDKFFLEKENQLYPLIIEEIEVKADFIHRKKTYIGVLKSVLNDCPEIQASIDQSKLVESSMSEIIEKYNDCVNIKPVVYKKTIPIFRFRVSPLFGLSYTRLNASASSQFKLTYGYLENADLSQIVLTPGVGMQISTPRFDDQFSFYTEIRYINNSINDKAVYKGATYDQFDVALSYSYLYVPILFQYDFPISINYSIFLRLGLIKTFNLTNSSTVTKTQSSYPVPPVIESDRFDFYSSQTGYVGGIGVQRKYSKKNIIFLEARFENPGAMINNVNVGLASNVYSIITGVSF